MTDDAARLAARRRPTAPPRRWPWAVAATAFVTLIGAAGFRSAPGVLIDPLHAEFGWSTATISSAVSLNLLLYGVMSPFAAALMERFGMRRVVAVALLLVAAGSGLTVFMSRGLAARPALGRAGRGGHRVDGARVRRRRSPGAGSCAGAGWSPACSPRRRRAGRARVPAADGLARRDRGLAGGLAAGRRRRAARRPAGAAVPARPALGRRDGRLRRRPGDGARRACCAAARRRRHAHRAARRGPHQHVLAARGRVRDLRGDHRRPARHPLRPRRARPRHARHHRRGLLAVVGVFDVARHDRVGLAHRPRRPAQAARASTTCCAACRCCSCRCCSRRPRRRRSGRSSSSTASTGSPPCRRPSRCAASGSARAAPIVFGWVFAAHQVGSAIAAVGAGLIRDLTGAYDGAWWGAGALCVVAAGLSLAVRRTQGHGNGLETIWTGPSASIS